MVCKSSEITTARRNLVILLLFLLYYFLCKSDSLNTLLCNLVFNLLTINDNFLLQFIHISVRKPIIIFPVQNIARLVPLIIFLQNYNICKTTRCRFVFVTGLLDETSVYQLCRTILLRLLSFHFGNHPFPRATVCYSHYFYTLCFLMHNLLL